MHFEEISLQKKKTQKQGDHHSFIQQTFFQHLLSIRRYSGNWEESIENRNKDSYSHEEKLRQKREGLPKEKKWVNSSFNEELTEIITEKATCEQRPKGGEGSAMQITGNE